MFRNHLIASLLGVLISACASRPPPLVLTGAAVGSAITTCDDLPPRAIFVAASLRRQGISGTVLVRVTVDAGGQPAGRGCVPDLMTVTTGC